MCGVLLMSGEITSDDGGRVQKRLMVMAAMGETERRKNDGAMELVHSMHMRSCKVSMIHDCLMMFLGFRPPPARPSTSPSLDPRTRNR
jgi:hypothetical protein